MPKRGRERWKDPGYPCRDCEAYYNSFMDEERSKRVQASCRHRSETKPAPKTPPGFWDIDFPSIPEYMASGALVDGDTCTDVPVQPLRERRMRRLRKWRRLHFSRESKIEEDNKIEEHKDSATEKKETESYEKK